MLSTLDMLITFIISCLSTLFLVYPVKWLAFKLKIIDYPNERKINIKPMPRLGGLAIVLGTFIGFLYLNITHVFFLEYIIGATVIAITGIMDDKFTLPPMIKLLGQTLAAIFLIWSGILIERITLPFIGIIELNLVISVMVTLVWIIGITNAINLIDGLDGLASGVSTIALTSIFFMAIIDHQYFVAGLCVILIGSNIGFLFHNFYPAKIYMGDTGSLFLGYSIAVISILGLFKKITLFSFVIPIIALAVPIFDTLFAILRRLLNGEKIMKPDKKHIHHQLLEAGFSHRKTVLIIYCISAVFGALAVIFSKAPLDILFLITVIWVLLIYILAEFVGLVGKGKRPILTLFKRILKMDNET